MQENNAKKVVLEFLDFMKYKVENDLLTMAEIESFAGMLEEELLCLGTLDDFARFYGQNKGAVSVVINRKMIEKPVRRVYYRFNAFRKLIPAKWHRGGVNA